MYALILNPPKWSGLKWKGILNRTMLRIWALCSVLHALPGLPCPYITRIRASGVLVFCQHNEKKGATASFTLKKNEIEGLTMHRDHTRTCLLSALITSYAKTNQNPFRAAKADSSNVFFKRKRPEHFSFSSYKEPLLLFLYRISILSSKVAHTGSIHEYTRPVMLIVTPKGLTAICHAWSQADPNTQYNYYHFL
jgi:hypothetical protein